VIAQCVNCYSTHLSIFTGCVVPRNHALNFIAQGLIQARAGEQSPRGEQLRHGAGLEHFASMLRV
jgi:hypothetical protein